MAKLSESKIIWMYWDTGWGDENNLPYRACDGVKEPLVVKCVESWKHYNPGWEIRQLDDSTLSTYVDLREHIVDWETKSISVQAKSDIIRLCLLKQYGGVWVDATLWCHRPLDEWIYDVVEKSNFFAFSKPRKNILVSSWFLAAGTDSFIIDMWYNSMIDYFKNRKRQGTYFWVHVLFGTVYNTNMEFKRLWDRVNDVGTAPVRHYFCLKRNITGKVTTHFKNKMNRKEVPVYKFSLRHKHDLFNMDRVKYLYNNLK